MKFEERYQLQVPLAQSERGTSWNARDSKLNRDVVVAVVEGDAPEELKTRFSTEMSALAGVRHASVIRVFDTGSTEEEGPYASMETFDDETLEARMSAGDPIRVDQAVRMIADLLGAVSAVHAAGVVHGDIEPAHVLVKEKGGRVTPKLVGFGLNNADERGGDAGERLRTLAYTAPAQARGEVRADVASDVYSVAALLFSLLTGRVPHRGADAAALRSAASERAVPRVGDLREDLAGPIAECVDRALEIEPSARFESADALAKALRAALIRVRNPGALQTVAGVRSLDADDSDDALAEKRAQGPAPDAAGAPKPGLPKPGVGLSKPGVGLSKPGAKPMAGVPSAALPKAGLPAAALPKAGLPAAALPKTGLAGAGVPRKRRSPKPTLLGAGPPPEAAAPPKLEPAAADAEPPKAADAQDAGQLETAASAPEQAAGASAAQASPADGAGSQNADASDGDGIGFERLSGLLEAPADAGLEFERLSGLLEIPDTGPPKRVAPPPPKRASDADESAEAAGEPSEESAPEDADDGVPIDVEASADGEEPSEPPRADAEAAATSEGDDESSEAELAPLEASGEEPQTPPVAEKPASEIDAPEPEAEAPAAAAARAAAPEAPAAAVATETKPRRDPTPEAIAELEEASLGGSGRVPAWVWGACGVAAAAAILVAVIASTSDTESETTASTEPPASVEAAEPPSEPPAEPERPEEPAIPEPPEDTTQAPEDTAVAAPDEIAAADEAVEPAVEDPEPPAAPEPVVLTLTGVPDGASITVDGEAVSTSRVELDPSDARRTIEVRLDGHRTWSRTVSGDSSHELAVTLEAAPRRAQARRTPRETTRTPRVRNRPTPRRTARPGGRPTAVSDPGF